MKKRIISVTLSLLMVVQIFPVNLIMADDVVEAEIEEVFEIENENLDKEEKNEIKSNQEVNNKEDNDSVEEIDDEQEKRSNVVHVSTEEELVRDTGLLRDLDMEQKNGLNL